jgi:hypothetical protein
MYRYVFHATFEIKISKTRILTHLMCRQSSMNLSRIAYSITKLLIQHPLSRALFIFHTHCQYISFAIKGEEPSVEGDSVTEDAGCRKGTRHVI